MERANFDALLGRAREVLAAGNGIAIIGRLVTEIKDELIRDGEKYNNMVKRTVGLAGEFQIFERDAVSTMKTSEENLTRMSDVTDGLEQDTSALVELTAHFEAFERGLQKSVENMEDLKKRFECLTMSVVEVLGETCLEESKAGDRKDKASVAPQVGAAGGGLAGAGLAAFTGAQVISKFLPALGPVGIGAGIGISVVSGLGIGMLSGWGTGKVVSGYFESHAVKMKKLKDSLQQIDKVLAEKLTELTELMRLLSSLQDSSSNMMSQKENSHFIEYELEHFQKTSSMARGNSSRYVTNSAVEMELKTSMFDSDEDETCIPEACGGMKPATLDKIDDNQLEQLEYLADASEGTEEEKAGT